MAGAKRIVVDPKKLEEMRRVVQQGAQQLQETRSEVQAIAKALGEGALQGKAGAALGEGLQSKLCPAIERLTAKLQEIDGDILKELEITGRTDKQVATELTRGGR